MKQNYAEIRDHARRTVNGHPFDISDISALDVPPDQRQEMYPDFRVFDFA